MKNILMSEPSVFAVGKEYQIVAAVTRETLVSVKIGDFEYFDESNGIICSKKNLHKVCVPKAELEKYKEYTLRLRCVTERKPYFTETEDLVEKTYKFRVPEGNKINMYHISDTHNNFTTSVEAGKYFGEDLDVLILNGDIMDHCGKVENVNTIYRIAGELTRGEIPVIFSRGNHDLRGELAELLADYTPTELGRSYYTVKIGNIWGLILDCAEDKPDGNEEYGHTICCHNFRLRQTEFIKNIIKNADSEYNAPDVVHRVVIAHCPFTATFKPPFDIEQELFSEWARLLKDNVKPEVMICGHKHRLEFWEVGGEFDHKGQPCPVIIGGNNLTKERDGHDGYGGTAITFTDDSINIKFTNDLREVMGENKILLK